MDPVQDYVLSVMKQAKLDTLPDDLRLGLEEQLLVLVYRRIGLLVVKELGEQRSAEFFALIEQNPEHINHTAINEFLTEHIQHFDIKLKDALGNLAAQFLDNIHAQTA